MSLRRRRAEIRAARLQLEAAHGRARVSLRSLGARVAAQPLPWLGGVAIGGFVFGRVRLPWHRVGAVMPLLRGQIVPLAAQLGGLLGERLRRPH